MIFKDILQSKGAKLSSEINRLIEYAWKKQSHPGNLLLFHVNGFFNEEILEWNKIGKIGNLNPHVVGPGSEGHSEHTHNDFIHKYRTSHIHSLKHTDYVKKFLIEKWDKEISERNDALINAEETSIQLEMLIYLKFWEADMVIKKLYQFVRILQGLDYDWYFKIANSARDTTATGSRQDIIRSQIREPLKKISPILYSLIKDTYKTQIRNSIAHSNYSFTSRTIHLNNFIKNDPSSQLKGLTFDNWIDIFHNTLVLRNEYIGLNNKINTFYGKIAMKNEMVTPILITEKDGNQYELLLEYRDTYKDWGYKQSNT